MIENFDLVKDQKGQYCDVIFGRINSGVHKMGAPD